MRGSSLIKLPVFTAATLCAASTMTVAAGYTAKDVMEELQAEQRVPYMQGIIEGLAYARYIRDGKKTEGMGCIYDWFYKKPGTVDVIFAAFGQYPQYPPGSIVAALEKKVCGD